MGDAEPDTEERINFYAVVLDAGYPYKGNNRYICTLKVIDPTFHPVAGYEDRPMDWKFGLVTCYADRIEDLPVVRKIGDIIRVHKASVKQYKGIMQFMV